MHLLSVDKVAVMTLDLNFAFFFFLFFFFFLSRDVYSIHCQWRCVVFSGVRRGTPVCCCNYFDYTYYGVLQQPGERVQFNLQWISILTENEREREKKSLAGIFNQRRDIRIVARCELLCVCVCVFLCVNIISNRDAYWTAEFKGCTFPLLLISLPWWVLVCIQTYDSPGGLIGEACSPKRCQVPDSEQMLTNRNTNTPEGPRVCVCACVCIPLFD